MVNWILNLFGKANDWKLVWTETGEWILNREFPSTGTYTKIAVYKILFSKSLQKYRLENSGHKSNLHPMIQVARMQLIHLNKILINRN